MGLSWTTPGALWLLAAVPLVWIAARFARTNFNPRQRIAQSIVRSLVLAFLALALARPIVSAGSGRLSVVYLVDVSHSIDVAEITAAAKQIDDLNAAVRPGHFRIVAFGMDAAALENTDALRRLATTTVDPAKPPVVIDRSGTDLEAALTFARGALEAGSIPRIVLFSDGRPTSGSLSEAIAPPERRRRSHLRRTAVAAAGWRCLGGRDERARTHFLGCFVFGGGPHRKPKAGRRDGRVACRRSRRGIEECACPREGHARRPARRDP